MRLTKRTYALPPEILVEFEQTVEPGRRSQVVADILNRWLEQRKQEKLRMEVIEGCQAMAEVYLELEQEYHTLEEEATRALYSNTKTRRNRSVSARSRRRI